jgi:SAM-dependent methyltransferase
MDRSVTLLAAYALTAQCAAGLRTLVLQPALRAGILSLTRVRPDGLVAWCAAEIQDDALQHLGSAIPFGLGDHTMDAIAWLEGPRHDFIEATEILSECERVLSPQGWLAVRVPARDPRCEEPFWRWHDAIVGRFPAALVCAEIGWSGASFAICADQEKSEIQGPKIQVVESLIDTQSEPEHYLIFAAQDAQYLPVLSQATFVPETLGAAVGQLRREGSEVGLQPAGNAHEDVLGQWLEELAAQREKINQVHAELTARPALDSFLERNRGEEVLAAPDGTERIELAERLVVQQRVTHELHARVERLMRRLYRSEKRAHALARGEGLWLNRIDAALKLLVRRRDAKKASPPATEMLLQALVQRERAMVAMREENERLRAQVRRSASMRAVSERGKQVPEQAQATIKPEMPPASAERAVEREEDESLRELVAYLGIDVAHSAKQPPAAKGKAANDSPKAQRIDASVVPLQAEKIDVKNVVLVGATKSSDEDQRKRRA